MKGVMFSGYYLKKMEIYQFLKRIYARIKRKNAGGIACRN